MAGHSKWSTIKRKKGAADQKRGKIFYRTDVGLLEFVPKPSNAHVLDHPLAQRRGSLLCHWKLLSFD